MCTSVFLLLIKSHFFTGKPKLKCKKWEDQFSALLAPIMKTTSNLWWTAILNGFLMLKAPCGRRSRPPLRTTCQRKLTNVTSNEPRYCKSKVVLTINWCSKHLTYLWFTHGWTDYQLLVTECQISKKWNVDVLEMKRTAKDINVDLNIFNSVQIKPDDALSPCMLFISRYLGKRLSQKSQHTLFRAKYNLSRHVTIWWPADRLCPICADICISDTAA